jgi:hypothetical protein
MKINSNKKIILLLSLLLIFSSLLTACSVYENKEEKIEEEDYTKYIHIISDNLDKTYKVLDEDFGHTYGVENSKFTVSEDKDIYYIYIINGFINIYNENNNLYYSSSNYSAIVQDVSLD